MGYVDENYEDQKRIEKGNRFSWLFAAIVGIILAVILIALSLT